jgi:hypothetical protein
LLARSPVELNGGMGWNTSALFVRGEDALSLLPVSTTATGTTADVYQATTSSGSGDVFYVAQTGEWQQLWDPSMTYVVDSQLGRNTLSVFFSSVSSSYGFTLVEEGTLVRRAVYADRELVVSEGEPLPIESQIPVPSWGPDEDWVWAIVNDVTGLTYDEDQTFDVHAYAASKR